MIDTIVTILEILAAGIGVFIGLMILSWLLDKTQGL